MREGSPKSLEDLWTKQPRERPRHRPAPLLAPTLGLIGGIIFADLSGGVASSWLVLPTIVLFVVVVVACRQGAPRRGVIALVVLMACVVGYWRHSLAIDRPAGNIVHLLGADPTLTRVEGYVATLPIYRPATRRNPFIPFNPQPRTRFTLDVRCLVTDDSPHPITGRLRVAVRGAAPPIHAGQYVRLTGWIRRPSRPQNPGQRDWSEWYRRQRLDALMSVPDVAHVEVVDALPGWPRRAVGWLRGKARAALHALGVDVETDAGTRLLDVMVLGQRSAADQKLNEAFLRIGGMHFLAVSGFHVGLLAASTWLVVRWVLRRGQRTAAAMMVCVVVLYAAIAEMNAPIFRATTVVVCVGVASLLRRPVCVVNSLALAAGLVLLINPHELFGAGFQLSFVVTVALVTVVPRVYRLAQGGREVAVMPDNEADTLLGLGWLKLRKGLFAVVVAALVAYLASLPLAALHFGRFAPWGLPMSVLVSPFVVVTMWTSFLTLVFNLVPVIGTFVVIGDWLQALTGQLADLVLWIVALGKHLPGAVIYVDAPHLLVWPTYAIAAAWLWWRPAYKKPVTPKEKRPLQRQFALRIVAAAALTAVFVLMWVERIVVPGRGAGPGVAVHVLSVADGSATMITSPGGCVVYDIGSNTNTDVGLTMARAMRACGQSRAERAIISHGNFDHYSGLPTLCNELPVGLWMSNPYAAADYRSHGRLGRLWREMPRGIAGPGALAAGDVFVVHDAQFEVLWPPRDLDHSYDANNRSLVVRVSNGQRSVLMTGDIEASALRRLLDWHRAGRVDLSADVLIAPHHGAVLPVVTEALLQAVRPGVVVTSSRRERPRFANLVRDTLGEACGVYCTGSDGAVTVRLLNDGTYCVETPFARAE